MKYSFLDFLLEGKISQFSKKIIDRRNGLVTRGLNNLMHLVSGTGERVSSREDIINLAAKRLLNLKKNNPEQAKKLFLYFKNPREFIGTYGKSEARLCQKIASDLGLKTVCSMIGDTVEGIGLDAVKKIAKSTAEGAKIGGDIGKFTGAAFPSVAVGSFFIPSLKDVPPSVINDMIVQVGASAGQIAQAAASKAIQFLPNSAAGYTGATLGALVATKATPALIRHGANLISFVDKTTGKVIGWCIGGGVGFLKSFKDLGNLFNIRSGIHNARTKMRSEFMSPMPTRPWSELTKEVGDSAKEGWNSALTTRVGDKLDSLGHKANPMNWFRKKKT